MGNYCVRDLDPEAGAFSPILRLSPQSGEKSPVRGFHVAMVAGVPPPVSSGLAGCGLRAAADAGAVPSATAARLHGWRGRSRSVRQSARLFSGRLALLRHPGRLVAPAYLTS